VSSHQWGDRPSRKTQQNGRYGGLIVVGVIIVVILWIIGSNNSKPDVFDSSAPVFSSSGGSVAAPVSNNETVPWDYKIVESTVGDLIGGDMTIGPDNELLPNDDNYATGDKVFVLQFMNADITTRDDNKNDIHLSSWQSIKTYKTQKEADADLANLKQNLTADVDLVGVYKTEYQGKFRHFAIVTLPSGHTVKQPIDEARYAAMKDKKQVKVNLEEIHDFADYDLAMAKFRGWAD